MGRKRLTLAVAMLVAGALGAGSAYGQRGAAGMVRGPDGAVIGKQWLLVIGINEYGDESGWQKLHCAVSDAKAVRDALQSRYHIDQVFELYDRDATWARIDERFRWLAKHAQQDDGVLIYYAGHGHLDDLTKLGAWVPADGGRSPRSWMASTYIKRLIGSMKAKHVLLISDSCFAGDFFKTRGEQVETIDEPYYRRKYKLQSRQAITSGGVEPVMDSTLDGQSPFAHYLLRTLARNQKPYLVPRDLFDGRKLGVARNSGQTPEVGFLKDARDEGGEFILFRKQTAGRPPVPKPDDAAWQRRLAQLKRDAAERERREQERKEYLAKATRTFESLKQLDGLDAIASAKKAELWQAYLKDFDASGHQVAYARARLEHWRTHSEPVAPQNEGRVGRAHQGRQDGGHGPPYRKTNAVDGSEIIHVPAGTFTMGDGSEAHDVRVGAFSIGKCEVTNRQFSKFLQANPQWRKDRVDSKYATSSYLKDWTGDTCPAGKADHPVADVSWFAAKAYCEWAGGRLPTEAEWEYACRAGSAMKYCFGDSVSDLGEYAWYDKNSGGSTHPVGQKKPNKWGVHDMHGNVWEWCSSKYQPYPYKADDGREDMSDTGSRRVVRGGGWSSYVVNYCRSAYRNSNAPTHCSYVIGFRVVWSARAPR